MLLQGHHREKHHFRITPETNNRRSSISFSLSLCCAPSPHTYSRSSCRSFLSSNSLECVPFLCITFPQHYKINCTMECFNFLSSSENHANKTFSERSSCPVSGNNLLWVLLWKLWTNMLTLKVPILPWVQEQWHKYSFRWMLTTLGLIVLSYPHFNFLVILRNYGLWWKAKGYCCHGSKNIFFSSLKNSISETSGEKIILTALAEKIKFKYKFLQLYQLLFTYRSIFIYKDALQWA